MMISTNTFFQEKALKSLPPTEKNEVLNAFDKLNKLIETEEKYGTPFEKIFNNDLIKYDVLGKNFYTFKHQGKNKAQIRILYRFIRMENGTFELELHKVHIKRRTSKDYMKEFAQYVEHFQ